MGDVGYIDERGRLWFCGRKSQRVVTPLGTMFTIPCEAIFNNHPVVARSALVGLGRHGAAEPAIVIEPKKWPSIFSRGRLLREIKSLGKRSELTRSIEIVLFRRSFPVDTRHNAKIKRERLARWAERRFGIRFPWIARLFGMTPSRAATQS